MRRLLSLGLALTCTAAAFAWGAEVHRMITYVALDGVKDAPAWLRIADVRARCAFQANQPDRWRGWPSDTLKHENDPEHYLDAELLEQFGLTLETVPKLRREYVRALAIAKHTDPERVDPYDPAKDRARTHEWPGFVLHAIAQQYTQLAAAFNQVRILEQINDPGHAAQLEQARAIAIYHVGNLSHFVADAAQPLHTTRHYNGWDGPNPSGYKWRDRFHAYIDEGWATTFKLDYAKLHAATKFDHHVNAADPWDDVLAYFKRAHAAMEPLYRLETDQKLDGDEGRALLMDRTTDAAAMIAALLQAAYDSAAPTEEQVKNYKKYDAFDAAADRAAAEGKAE